MIRSCRATVGLMAYRDSDPSAVMVRRTPRLSRAVYRIDAVTLAQKLLGTMIVRIMDDGQRLSGIIVETEAYLGVEDRACHSYGGRRTPRNEAMYGRPGTSYVYFTYGMHHCFNVVCGEVGEPVAVLIRAIEPVDGIERMIRHRGSRGLREPMAERDLCSGPARLCQALAIDRELNGVDLTRSSRLWIEQSRRKIPDGSLSSGPRIGVDYAGPWAALPLRFWVEGSRFVSRKTPGRSGFPAVASKVRADNIVGRNGRVAASHRKGQRA